jgi:tetrahydromethanopterin S-methyltransferase subunit G
VPPEERRKDNLENQQRVAEAAAQAVQVIADAAACATKTIAAAAAAAAAAISEHGSADHDLIVELKVRMEGLKDDIKSLNDGISVKIDGHDKKIENIYEQLDELPCETCKKEGEAQARDIGWLQKIAYSVAGFIFVIIVPSLISLAVVWGNLNSTVVRNTAKWAVLDQEHSAVLQDVSTIKTKLAMR